LARRTARLRPERHPDLFATLFPVPAERRTRLAVGIDLGTHCGYAVARFVPGQPFDRDNADLDMGQWDLSMSGDDSGPMRYLRARLFLEALRPDLVFFEEPKYTPSEKPTKFNVAALLARAMPAATLLAKFVGAVSSWCEERGVPCKAYSIGAIKRFATGKGNANKEAMIAALNTLAGQDLLPVEGYETIGSDNIADAAWALLLGLDQYAVAYPETLNVHNHDEAEEDHAAGAA
jgi:hypothetical protein